MDKAMTCCSHKMSWRSEYTYTAHFHFLSVSTDLTFSQQFASSILKMEAVCSQDVINELLHHLAQQTCMYQCHVPPAASKVLILTISPVQSVRLWRVLKFYYETICVSEQCLIVFLLKNTWNNQLKPIFHSYRREANQSALEVTQAPV